VEFEENYSGRATNHRCQSGKHVTWRGADAFGQSQVFRKWLDDVLVKVPLREAPFTFTVAGAASRIELPQSDLGDIFLAATATAFYLTLVMTDSQLLARSWLKTMSND
jgi:hypothetical protein